MDVRARFEHELLAVETEHRVHCMLELTAPPAPAGRTRSPLHLALVLDRSGSMRGPKLEVVRECAAFLVRRLAPTDELALITYDDEVELVAPLAPVDQAALLLRIDAIASGGQTNLSGAWLKGVEEVRRASTDGPRKVLLLTDGLANVGITEPGELIGVARSVVESEDIGTTTIGFGADFSEDLLTAMADAGRGNAHFAETPDAAPGIFAQEFEDLMSLVAQNVSVEIRPSDDVQLVGILNAFPGVPVQGGLQLQLGDAYGEESRRVVFEFHIPSLASLGVKNVGEVVLRYTSIGEQIAQHEVSMPLVVNLVSADEAAAAGADAEVTEGVIVLKSTRAQQEAREHADRGEFDAARKLLADAAEELRRIAPASAKADELHEQAERLEFHSTSMSQDAYDAVSRKRMRFEERMRYENRKRKPPTTDPDGS